MSTPPTPAGPPPGAAALRYAFALAATAAALAVSLALREWVAPNVFLFFFTAIVLSAWYGGRGPALVATALTLPLANYFFLGAEGQWSLSVADVVRLVVFAGVAVLIGAMHDTLARARDASREAQHEAELQAAELQEQAAELEMQAAELQQQTAEAHALAQALEEAQERLRAGMEGQLAEAQALAHVGSWEWVPAEDRLWWSDEMHRVYGLEPGAAEVSLAAFLERVHPDDRERVREAVGAAVASGEAFEFEHRIVRPDGAVRRLHARGTVERGPDGTVARMSGTGQDVTEQRAAEEGARRLAEERGVRAEAEVARRRLEALLESIGDAFVALDRELRYTYVNRRAEATLGKPREELLGRTLEEAFPRAVGGVGWREMRRALESGEPRSFEYDSAALGRTVSVRVFPTEEGVSVFYEDVTEVRRAERVERLLAEAGRALAAPLEVAETLSALPRLLVPALADVCAVVTAGPEGGPAAVEVRHADPEKAGLVRDLLRSYADRPDAGSVALRVLRTGEPVLVERVEEGGVALADPARQRVVEALGMRSLLAVPLRAESRVLGVMALATAESGRRLGPPEAALAAELARR
ncbi:MAG TPA: PAS domain-containing protein, partial [Longimicrobium sp.]|nr:PAS domain-containing protein [Longimicrobium sp.]